MKWFLCGVSATLGALKDPQPADSCLHTESSFTLGAISSTACTYPLLTQGLALTLPLMQLGLGWGFCRDHENNLVLVMTQCQV